MLEDGPTSTHRDPPPDRLRDRVDAAAAQLNARLPIRAEAFLPNPDAARRIVLVGVRDDDVIVHLAARAHQHGLRVEMIDLRSVADGGSWDLSVPGGGWIEHGDGDRVVLDGDCISVYARIQGLVAPAGGADRARWLGLLIALRRWLDVTAAAVVNRPSAEQADRTRPLHEFWLARQGLRVPPTLTTSDHDQAHRFVVEVGAAILVVASQMAAEGHPADPAALAELTAAGPVHLRRRIIGDDVRAHVVGHRVVAVRCHPGAAPKFRRIDLPPDLQERVVTSTREAGLVFAGWRFTVDHDGEFWCLGVDPMPSYRAYDWCVDGRLSDVLLQYLARPESVPRRRPLPPLARPIPPAGTHGHARQAWYDLVDEVRAPVAVDCTAPTDSERCGCGSSARLRRLCDSIEQAHALVDAQLDVPTRWRGITRRQHYDYSQGLEGVRYRQAFDWIVQANREVDESLLIDAHDRAVGWREYRTERLIVDYDYEFPDPADIRAGLAEVFDAQRTRQWPAPAVSAGLHLDLVSVHPFSDGNGRTARLMATAALVRAGYRSTLLTAVEEFSHLAPARYINLMDAFRFEAICHTRTVVGLVVPMAAHSAAAAWALRHGFTVADPLEPANTSPVTRRQWQQLRVSPPYRDVLCAQLGRLWDEKRDQRLGDRCDERLDKS